MAVSFPRGSGNPAAGPTAGNCWIAIVLILLLQLGCSPGTAPMSDAAQAKELLQKMLDEWKSGTSLDELKKRHPPVYFTEDLWRNGATLNEYVMTDASEVLGSNIRFKVNLKCTNKGGKAIERPVRYIVTTQPALTIVREEG
jgi:hypothetical protein